MSGDKPPANAQPSELKLRILSAVVMASVAIVTLWIGGWPFAVVWTLVGVIAALEWLKIVVPGSGLQLRILAAAGTALSGGLAHLGFEAGAVVVCLVTGIAIFAMAPGSVRAIAAVGSLYASAIAVAPIIVRSEPSLGLALIGWCFAVVWATDVAAYFTGRALGGPKLWPSVSPKKTWSGAIGGAIAGIMAGLLIAWVSRRLGASWTLGFMATAACALLASMAGQIGDLLESSLKRHFGVKDSGSIIPGHGGVLDRLDAFVVVVTLVAFAVAIWR